MVNNVAQYKEQGHGQTVAWTMFISDNANNNFTRAEYLKTFYNTWSNN